jgi:hypothetical protein
MIASVGGGPPIIECQDAIAGVWVGCETLRLLGPNFGYTVMQVIACTVAAAVIVLLSWHAETSARRS